MSINLSKGEKINLQKSDGSPLTKIKMGLGWDAARTGFLGLSSGGSIDLDASVVMLDENNRIVDTVSFSHLRSNDGSVKHSGDNLTGDGENDDESIFVDLPNVAPNVSKLVFTINSYRGQTFDKVENCFARMVDMTTNQEMFKYKLNEKGNHTGKIMCSVYRHNGAWKANAIGAPANGRTVHDMLTEIRAVI